MFEREFALPSMAALLATANDIGTIGLDFKVVVLVSALALGYAALRTWHKIATLKRA